MDSPINIAGTDSDEVPLAKTAAAAEGVAKRPLTRRQKVCRGAVAIVLTALLITVGVLVPRAISLTKPSVAAIGSIRLHEVQAASIGGTAAGATLALDGLQLTFPGSTAPFSLSVCSVKVSVGGILTLEPAVDQGSCALAGTGQPPSDIKWRAQWQGRPDGSKANSKASIDAVADVTLHVGGVSVYTFPYSLSVDQGELAASTAADLLSAAAEKVDSMFSKGRRLLGTAPATTIAVNSLEWSRYDFDVPSLMKALPFDLQGLEVSLSGASFDLGMQTPHAQGETTQLGSAVLPATDVKVDAGSASSSSTSSSASSVLSVWLTQGFNAASPAVVAAGKAAAKRVLLRNVVAKSLAGVAPASILDELNNAGSAAGAARQGQPDVRLSLATRALAPAASRLRLLESAPVVEGQASPVLKGEALAWRSHPASQLQQVGADCSDAAGANLIVSAASTLVAGALGLPSPTAGGSASSPCPQSLPLLGVSVSLVEEGAAAAASAAPQSGRRMQSSLSADDSTIQMFITYGASGSMVNSNSNTWMSGYALAPNVAAAFDGPGVGVRLGLLSSLYTGNDYDPEGRSVAASLQSFMKSAFSSAFRVLPDFLSDVAAVSYMPPTGSSMRSSLMVSTQLNVETHIPDVFVKVHPVRARPAQPDADGDGLGTSVLSLNNASSASSAYRSWELRSANLRVTECGAATAYSAADCENMLLSASSRRQSSLVHRTSCGAASFALISEPRICPTGTSTSAPCLDVPAPSSGTWSQVEFGRLEASLHSNDGLLSCLRHVVAELGIVPAADALDAKVMENLGLPPANLPPAMAMGTDSTTAEMAASPAGPPTSAWAFLAAPIPSTKTSTEIAAIRAAAAMAAQKAPGGTLEFSLANVGRAAIPLVVSSRNWILPSVQKSTWLTEWPAILPQKVFNANDQLRPVARLGGGLRVTGPSPRDLQLLFQSYPLSVPVGAPVPSDFYKMMPSNPMSYLNIPRAISLGSASPTVLEGALRVQDDAMLQAAMSGMKPNNDSSSVSKGYPGAYPYPSIVTMASSLLASTSSRLTSCFVDNDDNSSSCPKSVRALLQSTGSVASAGGFVFSGPCDSQQLPTDMKVSSGMYPRQGCMGAQLRWEGVKGSMATLGWVLNVNEKETLSTVFMNTVRVSGDNMHLSYLAAAAIQRVGPGLRAVAAWPSLELSLPSSAVSFLARKATLQTATCCTGFKLGMSLTDPVLATDVSPWAAAMGGYYGYYHFNSEGVAYASLEFGDEMTLMADGTPVYSYDMGMHLGEAVSWVRRRGKRMIASIASAVYEPAFDFVMERIPDDLWLFVPPGRASRRLAAASPSSPVSSAFALVSSSLREARALQSSSSGSDQIDVVQLAKDVAQDPRAAAMKVCKVAEDVFYSAFETKVELCHLVRDLLDGRDLPELKADNVFDVLKALNLDVKESLNSLGIRFDSDGRLNLYSLRSSLSDWLIQEMKDNGIQVNSDIKDAVHFVVDYAVDFIVDAVGDIHIELPSVSDIEATAVALPSAVASFVEGAPDTVRGLPGAFTRFLDDAVDSVYDTMWKLSDLLPSPISDYGHMAADIFWLGGDIAVDAIDDTLRMFSAKVVGGSASVYWAYEDMKLLKDGMAVFPDGAGISYFDRYPDRNSPAYRLPSSLGLSGFAEHRSGSLASGISYSKVRDSAWARLVAETGSGYARPIDGFALVINADLILEYDGVSADVSLEPLHMVRLVDDAIARVLGFSSRMVANMLGMNGEDAANFFLKWYPQRELVTAGLHQVLLTIDKPRRLKELPETMVDFVLDIAYEISELSLSDVEEAVQDAFEGAVDALSSPPAQPSSSASPSVAASMSPSMSRSASVSGSASRTASASVSRTASVSSSVAASVTPSSSFGSSASASSSVAASVTVSSSVSPSMSGSSAASVSGSSSVSASSSESSTGTVSASITASMSVSPTRSGSTTMSMSASVSETASSTPSVSVTPSSPPIVISLNVTSSATTRIALMEGGKLPFKLWLSRPAEFPTSFVLKVVNNQAPRGSPLTTLLVNSFSFKAKDGSMNLVIPQGMTVLEGEVQAANDGIISGDFDVDINIEATGTAAAFNVSSIYVTFKDMSMGGLFFAASKDSGAAVITEGIAMEAAAASSFFLVPRSQYMYPFTITSMIAPLSDDAYTAMLHTQAGADLPMPDARYDKMLSAGATSLPVDIVAPNDDFAVGNRSYLLTVTAKPDLSSIPSGFMLGANHPVNQTLTVTFTVRVTDNDEGMVALAVLTDSEAPTLATAASTTSFTGSMGAQAGFGFTTIGNKVLFLKEGMLVTSGSEVVQGTGTSMVLNLGLTRRFVGTLFFTISGPADVSLIPDTSAPMVTMPRFLSANKTSGSLTFSVSSASYKSGQPLKKILVVAEDDPMAQGPRGITIIAKVNTIPPDGSYPSFSSVEYRIDRMFDSISNTDTMSGRMFNIEDDDMQQLTRSFTNGVKTFTVATGSAMTDVMDALEVVETTSGSFSVSSGFAGGAVAANAQLNFALKARPFKFPADGSNVNPANVIPGTVTVTLSSEPKVCAYGVGQFTLRPTACNADADCQTMRPEFAFMSGMAVPSALNVVASGKCVAAPQLVFSPSTLTFTTTVWSMALPVSVAATNNDFDNVGAGVRRDAIAGGLPLRAYGALIKVTVTGDLGYPSSVSLPSIPVIIHDDDQAGVDIVPFDELPNGRLYINETGGTAARRYSLRLKTLPRADVVITPVIPAAFVGLMKLTVSQLTFTTENYMTPQNIGLTVADNLVDDGDGRNDILTHTISSDDALYARLPSVPQLPFTVLDDDISDVIVSGPGLLSGTRNLQLGAATFVYVALATQPTSSVTVALEASMKIVTTSPASTTYKSVPILASRPLVIPENQSATAFSVESHALDVSTSAASYLRSTLFLTFTPSNWNKPQVVPVLVAKTNGPITDITADVVVRATVTSSADLQYISLPTDETNLGKPVAAVTAAGGYTVGTTTVPFYLDEGGASRTVRVYYSGQLTSSGRNVNIVKIQGNCIPAGGRISLESFCFQDSDCGAGGKCETLIDTPTVSALFFQSGFPPYVDISLTAKDDQVQRAPYFPVAIALLTDASNEIGRIQVMVKDNDGAALLLTGPNVQTITEGGTMTLTYQVALKTKPSASVTLTPVAFSDAAPGYGLIFAPPELVFSDTNYATAQTVTVKAKDDKKQNRASGNIPLFVRHQQTSIDADYSGLDTSADGTVSFASIDNDEAAILFCATTDTESTNVIATMVVARKCSSAYTGPKLNIVEGGSSQRFFVGLATDPTAGGMTVRLSADHPIFVSASGSLTDRLELNFADSSSALTPVEISVLNDFIDSGPRMGSIRVASANSAFFSNPEYDSLPMQSFNYSITDNDRAMVYFLKIASASSLEGLRSASPALSYETNQTIKEGDFMAFYVDISDVPAGRQVTVDITASWTRGSNPSTLLPLVIADADFVSQLLTADSATSDVGFATVRKTFASDSPVAILVAYARNNDYVFSPDAIVNLTATVVAAQTTDPGFLAAVASNAAEVQPLIAVTVQDTDEQRLFVSAFKYGASGLLPMAALPSDRAFAADAAGGGYTAFPLLKRLSSGMPTVYLLRTPVAANGYNYAVLPSTAYLIVGLAAKPLGSSVTITGSVSGVTTVSVFGPTGSSTGPTVAPDSYLNGGNFSVMVASAANSDAMMPQAQVATVTFTASSWTAGSLRAVVFESRGLIGVVPSAQAVPSSPGGIANSTLTAMPFVVSHNITLMEGQTTSFGFMLTSEPADVVTVEYTLYANVSGQSIVRFLRSDGAVLSANTGTMTFGPSGDASVNAWNSPQTLRLSFFDDRFASKDERLELCFKYTSKWPVYASGTTCTRIDLVDNDQARLDGGAAKGTCSTGSYSCGPDGNNAILEGTNSYIALTFPTEIRDGLLLSVSTDSAEVMLPKAVIAVSAGASSAVIPFSIVDNTFLEKWWRNATVTVVAAPVRSSAANAAPPKDIAYDGLMKMTRITIADDEVATTGNKLVISASVPLLDVLDINGAPVVPIIEGADLNITVRLTSRPAPNTTVSVSLTCNDGNLVASPARLEFDSSNSPQAVNISAPRNGKAASFEAVIASTRSTTTRLQFSLASSDDQFNNKVSTLDFARIDADRTGVRFVPDAINVPVVEGNDYGFGTRLILRSLPSAVVWVKVDVAAFKIASLANDAGIRIDVVDPLMNTVLKSITSMTAAENKVLKFDELNWNIGYDIRVIALNDTQMGETLLAPSVYTVTATIDSATVASEYTALMSSSAAGRSSSVKVVGVDPTAPFWYTAELYTFDGLASSAICETYASGCPSWMALDLNTKPGVNKTAFAFDPSSAPGLNVSAYSNDDPNVLDTDSFISITAVQDSVARPASRIVSISLTLPTTVAATSVQTLTFSVLVFDDDRAGLMLTPAETAPAPVGSLPGQPPILTLFESTASGAAMLSDSFNISLTSQPQGTVTVTVRESPIKRTIPALGADAATTNSAMVPLSFAAGAGTATSSVLTFTAMNWNNPQIVKLGATSNNMLDKAPRMTALEFVVDEATVTDTSKVYTFSPSTGWAPEFIPPVARVQVLNVDQPGVKLSVDTVSLAEPVSSPKHRGSVTVSLTAKPKATVAFIVQEPARGGVIVDAASKTLRFGPDDWATPKVIGFEAVENPVDEGKDVVRYVLNVIVDVANTNDADFAELKTVAINVDVDNDDKAGVEILPMMLALEESTTAALSTKTYQVRLLTKPDSGGADGSTEVRIALAAGTGVCRKLSDKSINVTMACVVDSDCGSVVDFQCFNRDSNIQVTPSMLTFTSADWNIKQTVTVMAIDDSYLENEHKSFVRHSVIKASTGDAAYAALSLMAKDVMVTITDNDKAGIAVGLPSSYLAAAGLMAVPLSEDPASTYARNTFTVALTAAPVAPVTVTAAFDSAQVMVRPSSVVFTSSNWNMPVTLNAIAVNDAIDEAKPHASEITFSMSSTETAFTKAAADLSRVPLRIMDDDYAGVTYSFPNQMLDADGVTSIFVRAAPASGLTDDACRALCSQSRVSCAVSGCVLFFQKDQDLLLQESAAGDKVLIALTSRPTGNVTVTVPGASKIAPANAPATATKCLSTQGDVVTPAAGTAAPFEQLKVTSSNVAVLTFTPDNWAMPQTVMVEARDDRLQEAEHTVAPQPTLASTDGNYNGASNNNQLRKTSCASSSTTSIGFLHPDSGRALSDILAKTPTRFRVSGVKTDGSECLVSQAAPLRIVIREDALAMPPAIISAKFSNDLTKIIIKFDQAVANNTAFHDALAMQLPDKGLSGATFRLLTTPQQGELDMPSPPSSVCSAVAAVNYPAYLSENRAKLAQMNVTDVVFEDDFTARLSLPPSGTLVDVGAPIAVVPGSLKGKFALAVAPIVTYKNISAPDAAVKPVVDLGETVSVGRCKSVTVSAGVTGEGGRAPTTISWSLVSAMMGSTTADITNSIFDKAKAILATASLSTVKAKRVTFGADDLPPGYTVTIKVAVTNFLGQIGSDTKMLVKQTDSGPDLTAVTSFISINTNEPLQADIRASFFKCPGDTSEPSAEQRAMTFYWFADSTIDPYDNAFSGLFEATELLQSAVSFQFPNGNGKVLKSTNMGRQLLMPAYSLPGNRAYAFRVYAIRNANPSAFSFVDISVYVSVPAPIAMISGFAAETVSISDPFAVDASKSYDPSTASGTPQGTASYSWTCMADVKANTANNIIANTVDLSTATAGVLLFSARDGRFTVGATYIFTVTYKVGTRTAMASKTITVANAKPLAVYASLLNAVSGSTVRLGSDVLLTSTFVLPDPKATVRGVTYSWAQAAGPALPAPVFTAAATSTLPLGAMSSALIIGGSALASGSAYEFCVVANAGSVWGKGRGCVKFSTPEQPVLGTLTLSGTVFNAFNNTDISLPPLTSSIVDTVEFTYRAVSSLANATSAVAAINGPDKFRTPAGTVFETRSPTDLSFTTKNLPEGILVISATAKTKFGTVSTAVAQTFTAYTGTASGLAAYAQKVAKDGDPVATSSLTSGTIALYGKGKSGRLLRELQTVTPTMSPADVDVTISLLQDNVAQSVPGDGKLAESAVDVALNNLRDAIVQISTGRLSTSGDWTGTRVSALNTALVTILQAYTPSRITGFLTISTNTLSSVYTIAKRMQGVSGFSESGTAEPAMAVRNLIAKYCSWPSPFAAQVSTDSAYVLASTTFNFLPDFNLRPPQLVGNPTPATPPTVTFSSATLSSTTNVMASTQLLVELRSGLTLASVPANAIANGGFGLQVFAQTGSMATPVTVVPSASSSSTDIATFTFPHLATYAANVANDKIIVARYYNGTAWNSDGLTYSLVGGVPQVSTTTLRDNIQLFLVNKPALVVKSGTSVVAAPVSITEAAASRTLSLSVNLKGELSSETSSVTVAVSMPSGVCIYVAPSTFGADGAPLNTGSPDAIPRFCSVDSECGDSTNAKYRCTQMLATASPATLTFTSTQISNETPQTVTITAIEDKIVDIVGVTDKAMLTLTASGNAAFAALTSKVTANIADADTAGYIINPALPARIGEAATESAYTVSLKSRPLTSTSVAIGAGVNGIVMTSAGAVANDAMFSFASHFDLPTNTLPSAVFKLKAVNDKVKSPVDRTIGVVFSGWTGDSAYVSPPTAFPAPALITIDDDDVASIMVAALPSMTDAAPISELGGKFSFNVKTTSSPTGEVKLILSQPADGQGRFKAMIGGAAAVANNTAIGGWLITLPAGDAAMTTGIDVTLIAEKDGVRTDGGVYTYKPTLRISSSMTAAAEYKTNSADFAGSIVQARVQDVENPTVSFAIKDGAANVFSSSVTSIRFVASLGSPLTAGKTVAVVVEVVDNAANAAAGYDNPFTTAATTLTFTSTNYAQNQEVVIAIDTNKLALAYPSTAYAVKATVVSTGTTDDLYRIIIGVPVSRAVVFNSNGVPGVTYSQVGSGNSIAKGGASLTYLVQLKAKPARTSSFKVSNLATALGAPTFKFAWKAVSNAGGSFVDVANGATFQLASADWSQGVQVKVSALRDDFSTTDSTEKFRIEMTDGDAHFKSASSPYDVSVTVTDSQTALGFSNLTLTYFNGTTKLAGKAPIELGMKVTMTFDGLLAKPSGDMQLVLMSNNSVRFAPLNGMVTISPAQWNVRQSVDFVRIEPTDGIQRPPVDVSINATLSLKAPASAYPQDRYKNAKIETSNYVVPIAKDGIPSVTPTPSVAATSSPSSSVTPSRTASASVMASPSVSPSVSASATVSPTRSGAPTTSPSGTPPVPIAVVKTSVELGNIPASAIANEADKQKLVQQVENGMKEAIKTSAQGAANDTRVFVKRITNADTGAVVYERPDSDLPKARLLQATGNVKLQVSFFVYTLTKEVATAVTNAVNSNQGSSNTLTTKLVETLKSTNPTVFSGATASVKEVATVSTVSPSGSSTPSSDGDRVGAIVGGTIGGIVAIAALAVGGFLLYKRTASKKLVLSAMSQAAENKSKSKSSAGGTSGSAAVRVLSSNNPLLRTNPMAGAAGAGVRQPVRLISKKSSEGGASPGKATTTNPALAANAAAAEGGAASPTNGDRNLAFYNKQQRDAAGTGAAGAAGTGATSPSSPSNFGKSSRRIMVAKRTVSSKVGADGAEGGAATPASSLDPSALGHISNPTHSSRRLKPEQQAEGTTAASSRGLVSPSSASAASPGSASAGGRRVVIKAASSRRGLAAASAAASDAGATSPSPTAASKASTDAAAEGSADKSKQQKQQSADPFASMDDDFSFASPGTAARSALRTVTQTRLGVSATTAGPRGSITGGQMPRMSISESST